MTFSATQKPTRLCPQVMNAEDDPDDQLLIRDAMSLNGFSDDNLVFVSDGEELINALENMAHVPDILLLDLNMPKIDGRQALQVIKTGKKFKHIPVIVFSTSNETEDIRLTYESGGNSYITKPNNFDVLVAVCGTIKQYWLETAVLSPRE